MRAALQPLPAEFAELVPDAWRAMRGLDAADAWDRLLPAVSR